MKESLSRPSYCRFGVKFAGSTDKKNKKITNWQLEHQRYIDEWMLMEQNNMGIHAVHHDKAFHDYLVWFGQRTRLQLRPAWTEQDIADIASEDEGNNPYDQAIREGRQVEIAPALARPWNTSFTTPWHPNIT